jgi:hypothetical protein
MITHIVLFRPKATLGDADRQSLIASLQQVINEIPLIRRATIGRRVKLDRPGYETLMREHYEYLAAFEFDSETDLRAYLDHPSHALLGKQLFMFADAVLAYDFSDTTGEELPAKPSV